MIMLDCCFGMMVMISFQRMHSVMGFEQEFVHGAPPAVKLVLVYGKHVFLWVHCMHTKPAFEKIIFELG